MGEQRKFVFKNYFVNKTAKFLEKSDFFGKLPIIWLDLKLFICNILFKPKMNNFFNLISLFTY